jgi:hypothetical protein
MTNWRRWRSSHIILENRTSRAERRLFVHLPDKSLVFLMNASKILGEPVWYVAQSGSGEPYRLRMPSNATAKPMSGMLAGNLSASLTDTVSTHFGDAAEWKFDVGLLYNQAKGGIVNSIELVGLPGALRSGSMGTAWLSMTRDGQNFSVERGIPMGARGTDELEACSGVRASTSATGSASGSGVIRRQCRDLRPVRRK